MMSEIACEINEIVKFEQEINKKFDFIKLSFVNLHGVVISEIVTRKALENVLKHGFPLYSGYFTWDIKGNSIPVKELLGACYGNCQIIPIKNTLHILPWNSNFGNKPRLVGELFCEGKWLSSFKNGAFIEACTRNSLRRALASLKEIGYFVKSAFEIEFTVFQKNSLELVSNIDNCCMNSSIENLLFDIMEISREAGVEMSGFHLEDMESQFEFNLNESEGITAVDSVMVVKQAIKEVFSSKGYLATFMSKPTQKAPNSSFHLNLSLWKSSGDGQETNVFYSPSDENKMSDVCKHFLAGLLDHAKALTALFCPTVNCYRRLHDTFSPDKIEWNVDDRLVTFRVKESDSGCYLENRIPSSACNLYLVLAATLVAGMDGIVKKTPLPKPAQNEREKVLGKKVKPENKYNENDNYLPYSLEEALGELEKDDVLRDGLGQELVRWFVAIKKKGEIDVINSVSEENRWDLERELYLQNC